MSATSSTELRREPREDDELLVELIRQIEIATKRAAGHSADQAATSKELRAALRKDCEIIGQTALEVSDSLRNWATHIPWDVLVALQAPAPAESSDWKVVSQQLSEVGQMLSELASPSHLNEGGNELERFALDKNAYDFYRPAGKNLLRRTEDYYEWVQARRQTEMW